MADGKAGNDQNQVGSNASAWDLGLEQVKTKGQVFQVEEVSQWLACVEYSFVTHPPATICFVVCFP